MEPSIQRRTTKIKPANDVSTHTCVYHFQFEWKYRLETESNFHLKFAKQ